MKYFRTYNKLTDTKGRAKGRAFVYYKKLEVTSKTDATRKMNAINARWNAFQRRSKSSIRVKLVAVKEVTAKGRLK